MRALYLVTLCAAFATATLGHRVPVVAREDVLPPSIRSSFGKQKAMEKLGRKAHLNMFVDETEGSNSKKVDGSAPIPSYPDSYYNYMPLDDGYNSNFFYKIESLVSKTARSKAPLVMWLQGGPGASSMLGAYMENGAVNYKVDTKNANGFTFEKNEFAWGKHATMLYVDNPIGTGFSYTDNPLGFSTTDEEIASNLVKFMKLFLVRHPEYVQNEFWVFSESYGGKMTAFFGNALAKAVYTDKTFPLGFKMAGAAIGDGWVDPVGCMDSYSSYLFSLGQVTEAEATAVKSYAKHAADAIAANNGNEATNQWSAQQTYIGLVTNGMNWYNSLTTFSYLPDNQLELWLQNEFPKLPEVTKYVNITRTFGAQSNEVFEKLSGAFMRDGIQQIKGMLDLGVKVAVYVGEVDLIVDPVCVKNFVNKLDNWKGIDDFRAQRLVPFTSADFAYPQQVLATRQSYANLELWTVSTAGHMVPADSPHGAELMFTHIVGTASDGTLKSSDRQVAPLGKMTVEKLFEREVAKQQNAKQIDITKRYLPL